jgi:Flp pilus assembly protein TadG
MLFPVREGPRPLPRRRSGAAAVEFALVAPLLVLLVLGMIEFGRMIMVEQILTNAAREGARKAVLPGVTQAQVETAIDDYLKNSSVKGQSRTVSPNPGSATGGTSITVTVSVPYNSVTWLPVSRFLSGKTLSASVIMRKEDQ